MAHSVAAVGRWTKHLYSTDLGPCPYLGDRQERRLVALLEPGESEGLLDLLTRAGFRRSQHALYRPACPDCQACVPVRIVVAGFRPSRAERRVLKRNADLTATVLAPHATPEQFELFRRYLHARHDDGGMAGMGFDSYGEMIEAAAPGTRLVEFRDRDERLVGVSLTDQVASGLSGVYKFFDPEEERRSLGTFIILWHVQHAREQGLPYVYLGYWIADCRKMAYKARFAPLERLRGADWLPVETAS